jgi:hypothetical protein
MFYGNGQPARRSIDDYLVSVTPIVLCELDDVINDKDICAVDEVKIPFPRYVIRLRYDGSFHRLTLLLNI